MPLNEEMKKIIGLNETIENIYCRFSNEKKFLNGIEHIPHEKNLDFLTTYYIRFKISGEDSIIMTINYKIMDSWGITEKQLKDIAWCNTKNAYPPICKPLKQVLLELGLKAEEGNDNIYIITNMLKDFGAVVIGYPGFLSEVSKKLGGDFYILPSSIHACLAISCEDGYTASKLREMVYTINKTELDPKEVLSYSVYRYESGSDRLLIDNS